MHGQTPIKFTFYVVDSDVAEQYTENALLLFHCNNGYANAQQC